MISRVTSNNVSMITTGPFDFFNDYKDTRAYLLREGYINLALHLENRYNDYCKRYREDQLDTRKLYDSPKYKSKRTNKSIPKRQDKN